METMIEDRKNILHDYLKYISLFLWIRNRNLLNYFPIGSKLKPLEDIQISINVLW